MSHYEDLRDDHREYKVKYAVSVECHRVERFVFQIDQDSLGRLTLDLQDGIDASEYLRSLGLETNNVSFENSLKFVRMH